MSQRKIRHICRIIQPSLDIAHKTRRPSLRDAASIKIAVGACVIRGLKKRVVHIRRLLRRVGHVIRFCKDQSAPGLLGPDIIGSALERRQPSQPPHIVAVVQERIADLLCKDRLLVRRQGILGSVYLDIVRDLGLLILFFHRFFCVGAVDVPFVQIDHLLL